MSKHQTIREIKQELSRLNKEIDLRIIHGVSYAALSRRHRFLMSQLRRLGPSRLGWFGRSFSFISTFVF